MKQILRFVFALALAGFALTSSGADPGFAARAPFDPAAFSGGAVSAIDPTTDAAPGAAVFGGANAYPQAAVNTTGGNVSLCPGIGRRLFTIVDYSLVDAIDTVTVTVNGSATVKTAGGTDWTAATSNAATATSLATAISTISGVSAATSGSSVYLTPSATTCTLTLATSMDAGEGTATSGTDGTATVTALGLSSLAAQATNTVVGNATAVSAAPTALAVGSCSTSASALTWTTNTGFACNTAIAASTVTNFTGTTSLTNNTGAGTLQWPAAGATLVIPTGGGTLGTAAFTASTAYATSAQGATADTAVQPATAPALTGTNFTSIPAAQLSGTITSATQDLITRTSTITSGVWNAGSVTSNGAISGVEGNFSGNVGITKASALLTIAATGASNAALALSSNSENGYSGTIRVTSKTTGGVSNIWSIGTNLTGGTNAWEFYDGAGTRFSIGIGGLVSIPSITTDATHTDASVCVDTTTKALYFGSGALGVCLGTSSERYKSDITSLQVGLSEILAMQPVSYRLKSDPSKLLYGFIAERDGLVLPDLLGRDTQGRPNTFDYLGVVPVLVNAVQAQQAQIAELRARLQ